MNDRAKVASLTPEILPADATVTELLRPIVGYLTKIKGATDLFVNRPGEVFVKGGSEKVRFAATELTFERCLSLAGAIARFTNQTISAKHPILSAQLPGGERMQIVIPPAVEDGTVSLSIRVPGSVVRSIEEYERSGVFNRFVWAKSSHYEERKHELAEHERKMFDALCAKRLGEFLRLAVRNNTTIAFIGATGSGKTSLMKSCAQLIPLEERLLTVEDTHELELSQEDRVHMYYSHGGQGQADLTPGELIQSGLRMNPDRILLGEVRGAPALELIDALQTGHAGSMTTYHAESCAEAYERYWGMCVQHPSSKQRSRDEVMPIIRRLLPVIVHMVAQVERDASGAATGFARFVKEVSYDPIRNLVATYGDATLLRANT